ncbi:MAG: PorV/PorQ family protein [Phaeodactylibacter sp.]|nr:PorV/PorQ family protein [Phaeodactylibacter sp.]
MFKTTIRLTLALSFLLFLQSVGWAQKYSNEFLSIGVSAGAQALGNAVVAQVDDVTATYWNPAGLASISGETGLQIGAMHAEWFAGIGKYDYLGMSLPMANSDRRLGISLIRFGIDGIPNTLSLYEDDGTVNYDNIVEFSAADYALFMSYAQKSKWLGGNLQVGGNFKIIRRQIGSFANSWGFGLDLGLEYALKQWRFGLMAKDVTTTVNSWRVTFTEEEKDVLLATGNELPDLRSTEITRPQLLLGAAYLFQFGKVSLVPELDFWVTTDGQRNTLISGDPFSVDMGFGLEAGYKDFVFLRARLNQFQEELGFDGNSTLTLRPSMGVGLKISSLVIDYAYTDLGDSQNRFSRVISLMLSLKPKT